MLHIDSQRRLSCRNRPSLPLDRNTSPVQRSLQLLSFWIQVSYIQKPILKYTTFRCVQNTDTKRYQCCTTTDAPPAKGLPPLKGTDPKGPCPGTQVQVLRIVGERIVKKCEAQCPPHQVAVRGVCRDKVTSARELIREQQLQYLADDPASANEFH